MFFLFSPLQGIIVFDKIENILELNTSPLQRDGKYVVQKYIERPLLIHKIKFDIRQWFLVTDFNPLTIWMYKDCYLRFCTQEFTLENTQQSVHLCNYSIQKYYKNDAERSSELPDENMWSNQDFVDNYLARQGRREAWEEIIYPGMKNAILCSMLSTQDIIEPRKNTFELYGADFMIGEDLKPWLIEINCSPTMARSTAVTNVLCDSVQEDVCKVVIDRKLNRNCDTGRFEILYKAPPVPAPNYIGIDLKVSFMFFLNVMKRVPYNITKFEYSGGHSTLN
jgi:tubulin monoglycylase TTLL3/8